MPFYRITQPFNPGGRGDAQFTLRFLADAMSGAEQLAAVNAWAASLNTAIPTRFCADITWGAAQIAEYERVVPALPNKPYFRDVTVPLSATTLPVAGAVAGQSTPPQIALVVSFLTGLAGRSRRGRVYTPNPPESVSDGSGGISDAAARGTMISAAATAVEGSTPARNIVHVVHSATTGLWAAITTYTANAQADTQRRRAS